MGEAETGAALRDMMLVALKLGGPVLAAALGIGIVMSLVQAVTQINEPTLAFIPKALAIFATMALLGPFMLATLSDYTGILFDRMVAVGGQ